MPTNRELEIIMRLKDEVSKQLKGIEGGLTRLGNTAHELGLKMRQTGREISYVGSSMVMAGTAITAPLIAAYKEAGKYNNDIAQQLYETKNVFQNLAVSIGTSLLPVMKQLTDMVARAVDWWNNLDKVTRDRLIQNIFKLGETLIGLGFALVVVGKSITFLANLALLASTLLALDPIIVGIVGGIGLLAIGMIKFKVVADAVCNTLELMWLNFKLNIQAVTLLGDALSNWGKVKKDWEDMNKSAEEMGNIFSGQNGKLASSVQGIKDQFGDVQKMWKDFQNSISTGKNSEKPEGNFFTGFMLALEDVKRALASWRDMGIQAGADLAKGIQENFKSFFLDAFQGQLKTATDYFKAFGDMILNIFADICSKIIERWIATTLVTGFTNLLGSIGSVGSLGSSGGAFRTASTSSGSGLTNSFAAGQNAQFGLGLKFHQGGIIRAHSGINLASDEVPIIAQSGERILSRSQNADYERNRGGGQTVVVLKMWDFTDLMKHKEEIQAIFAEGMQKNGPVRSAMKRYS